MRNRQFLRLEYLRHAGEGIFYNPHADRSVWTEHRSEIHDPWEQTKSHEWIGHTLMNTYPVSWRYLAYPCNPHFRLPTTMHSVTPNIEADLIMRPMLAPDWTLLSTKYDAGMCTCVIATALQIICSTTNSLRNTPWNMTTDSVASFEKSEALGHCAEYDFWLLV